MKFTFLKNHFEYVIVLIASIVSLFTVSYFYHHNLILAYGDAESHINVSKRVIDSVTVGLAQLGGVWLPFQHFVTIPFVINDHLWKTGLGGSFVSMFCYVVSVFFIYKIVFLATKNTFSSSLASLIFLLNPNILYLQSTPLSEVPLIMTLIVALYFYLEWTINDHFTSIILAGLFIFMGSLIRYDAWFLIICSFFIIPAICYLKKYPYSKVESLLILYSAVAMAGIFFWLCWNLLIFNNAFFFLSSQYSAQTQQLSWLKSGQLPSYHNLLNSIIFYTVDSYRNVGHLIFALGLAGVALSCIETIKNKHKRGQFLCLLLICSPFLFYIVTLYLGISVIFLPGLVPESFEWDLFNVRYGIMMLPAAAIFIGLFTARQSRLGKLLLLAVVFLQLVIFMKSGYPISLSDGVSGLSARKPVLANIYMADHYDQGYIIFDDFNRSANPISLNIPMNKIIYVGNKPYWEEALKNPTRYVRWIILEKEDSDTVWMSYKNNHEFLTSYQEVYNYKNSFVYKLKW